MADTKQVILCPACGQQMIKVFLPEENIDLDFCDECGGIFFDCGELERLDSNSRYVDEFMKAAHAKFFAPVNQDITRKCPVCNIPMRKVKISDFEIDFCDECGGKFLDNGEVQKIHDIKDIKEFLS